MPPVRSALLAALFFTSALALAQAPDSATLAKANSGDAAAQFTVGDALEKSSLQADPDDRPNLLAQAAAWLRKSADQHHIPAELRLAECYRDGRGLPRDPAQSAQWYRRAAEQGDPTAQATLATLYSIGFGVPHDDSQAYFWFDLAASVPGPNQQKYLANRQSIGTRITADELAEVQHRLKQWRVSHPQPTTQP